MLDKTRSRVATDLDEHRRRTYVWLRRSIVIVTSVFLVTVLAYRFLLGMITEQSISAYYYHCNHDWPMRNLFFGSLCAMGLLLVVYQGYRDAENVALDIGGIALICVAFFPMEPPDCEKSWVDKVHYASAVIFFVSIIYVVWYRAHDTLEDISEKRRTYYKNTYRFTGFCMTLLVIVSIVLYVLDRWDKKINDAWLLWAEFFGVFVFWVFWLVKTVEIENSHIDEKDQSQVKSAIQHTGELRVN